MAQSVGATSKVACMRCLAIVLAAGFASAADVRRAIAVMRGAGEFATSNIRGTVIFTQRNDLDEAPVEVTVSMEGLPAGEHGFHVHENGDARTTTTETLGKHFTPVCVDSMCVTPSGIEPCSESCPVPCDMTCKYDSIHGFPPSVKRQAGDMGNITADASGRVEVQLILGQKKMSLAEAKRSVVGRSVVVHERADDGSQPFGNAGPAIAFGIIGIAVVSDGDTNVAAAPSAYPIDQAICVFQPLAPGTSGMGMALLTFVPDYLTGNSHMRLQALVSNLTVGSHSFHFHDYGDLSAGIAPGVLGAIYSDESIKIDTMVVRDGESTTKYQQDSASSSKQGVARHVGRMLTIHGGPNLDDPTVATAVCGIAKFGASLPGFDGFGKIEGEKDQVTNEDADLWGADTLTIILSATALLICICCTCLSTLYCRSRRMKQRKEVASMQERTRIEESMPAAPITVKRAVPEPRSPDGSRSESLALTPRRLDQAIDTYCVDQASKHPTLV